MPQLDLIDLLFLIAPFLAEEMTLTTEPKIKHIMGVIKSQNHRIAWVEKDLKNHVVPASLLWAARPGCSKTHPTWP